MMNIEWIANQIIVGNITYNKAILYIKNLSDTKNKIIELDKILTIKGFAKKIKKEEE